MKLPKQNFAEKIFAGSAIILLILTVLPLNSSAQTPIPAYKNSALSINDRVADLLGRMTLEEKIAQMTSLWLEKPDDTTGVKKDPFTLFGNFSAELAKKKMPDGIGHFARQRVGRNARLSAEYANAVQKWLLENTASDPGCFSRRDPAHKYGRGQHRLSGRVRTGGQLGYRTG